MQVYRKTSWSRPKTALFLVLLLLLAYLPVSSFLFFLKNDAFNGYFPAKFFMSESLHSDHFPWWNPYINFGLPQYGDMNSGFWSPITWLIAATVGYNAYSFTLELLLYILIAGYGMFTLCKSYHMSGTIAVVAASAYMCSGYMVGHLQHFNWISGAAFLPWCLWAFYGLQKRRNAKNLIRAAWCFYLLLASAHPGIIIGSVYFFMAYALFVLFQLNPEVPINSRLKKWGLVNAGLLLFLLLLSAGMIAGYTDILPYMTRGEKVPLAAAAQNSFTWPSFLSLLLPMGTVKMDSLFQTDVSMRNAYIGLPLLLFTTVAFFHRKTAAQRFFFFTGLFFLLLSLGGIFRKICYHLLPGMGYVRLNAEFMIFVLLCFILVAADFFDANIKRKQKTSPLLLRSTIFWIAISVLAIVVGMVQSFGSKKAVFFQTNTSGKVATYVTKLKALIDGLSFFDCLWIQGCIQLAFLMLIYRIIQLKKLKWLVWIGLADLIMATLIHLPFTGVGKASVSSVQTVLQKSPKGIPIPMLQPATGHEKISDAETGLVGNWSFYNKQLGSTAFAFYPVVLNQTAQIYQSWVPAYQTKPYVFVDGMAANRASLNILAFSGNHLGLSVSSDTASTLVYQQNNYPHWVVTNNQNLVKSAETPLLSVPINKGTQEVWFRFDPIWIRLMMMLSLATAILSIVVLSYLTVKRSYLSSQRQQLRP